MKVVIADRNLKGAEEACQEFNTKGRVAWAVEADVGDWESQKQAFEIAVERLGRVDYVFPIAGITEKPWNPKQPNGSGFVKPNLAVLNVNASGALYTCSLAIQQFRTQESGKYGFRGKSKLYLSQNPDLKSHINVQLLLYPQLAVSTAFPVCPSIPRRSSKATTKLARKGKILTLAVQ